MIWLAFSDLHLHPHRMPNRAVDAVEKDCLRVLEIVFEEAHNRKFPIFFCGDLYEIDKIFYHRAHLRLAKALRELHTKYPDVVMYMITGNHDYFAKNTINWRIYEETQDLKLSALAESPLDELARVHPNVKCIDFQTIEISGHYFTGIPYLHRREDVQKTIDIVIAKGIPAEKHILLLHNTPDECVHYSQTEFSYFDNRLLKNFLFVMNGHIHHADQKNEVCYQIGNPLIQKRSEKPTKQGTSGRGFWEFDTKKRLGVLHELDFPSFPPEFKPKKEIIQVKPELKGFESDSMQKLTTSFLKLKGDSDRKLLATGLRMLDLGLGVSEKELSIKNEITNKGYKVILTSAGKEDEVLYTFVDEYTVFSDVELQKEMLSSAKFYKDMYGLK